MILSVCVCHSQTPIYRQHAKAKAKRKRIGEKKGRQVTITALATANSHIIPNSVSGIMFKSSSHYQKKTLPSDLDSVEISHGEPQNTGLLY